MPSVRPQHTTETWLSREQIHSGDTCTSHVRGNELCVNGFWVPPTRTAPPAACEASPRCLPSFPVKMHINWILWCCCSPTLLFLWWPYLALYCTSLQRNHGTETHLVIVPQNITHQPTQSTTTKTRNPPWWLATWCDKCVCYITCNMSACYNGVQEKQHHLLLHMKNKGHSIP